MARTPPIIIPSQGEMPYCSERVEEARPDFDLKTGGF